MDSQGSLTKSGLLYESNYQEWEDHLRIMLKVLDADMNDPFGKLGNGIRISTLLKSLVVPRLLLVIPQLKPPAISPKWRSLLVWLEVAAKPFRLMELPISVRTRIWKFAIASQQGPIRHSITGDSPFGNKFIHPVTRVSHEIRSETLAIAWAHVRVDFEPSVRALRLYRSEQFGSRYADRFHQLDAFEQSNSFSRFLPVSAIFPIFEKGSSQACGFLMLEFSHSLPNKVKVFHEDSGRLARLAPLVRRKIESHFDLASRGFSSSRSSTALAAMSLLGAPGLWDKPNLECDTDPTKPTPIKRTRPSDGDDLLIFSVAGHTTVHGESSITQ
jgi:hypothetical protein